jgi:hypothetical protein
MTSGISASDLLRSAEAAYASRKVYADEGDVTLVMRRGPASWERTTQVFPFRTMFIRPDRFRFELREKAIGPEEEWHRSVTWWDGNTVRGWWTVQPVARTYPTLGNALAVHLGVSGTASAATARLLMPARESNSPMGELHSSLVEASTAKVIGRERIGDADCWRIEGTHASGTMRSLWIDSRDSLLRQIASSFVFNDDARAKMREGLATALAARPQTDPGNATLRQAIEWHETKTPDFTSHTRIVFRPAIDPTLDRDAFQFTPPTT